MDLELWQKRRKELSLTYDDLAKLSGVSKRTVAGIFGGDYQYRSPTLNTVQAIEKALGISETNALQKEISPNAIVVDDEEEKTLIMCFRSITRDAKDAIMFNVRTAYVAYRLDKKED